jgi:hypothetical protein
MVKSREKRREWGPYSVGEPSANSKWTNTDCCPLNTVYHICHVSDALRIFEDGRIRSSLVWDESKLRNTRTCVAWLSPNRWARGSIYGNIRFDFDWKELVDGKQFYWVEAIAHYRPPAYRILITSNQPTLKLHRYSPKHGNGPLYYDAAQDQWYCNQKYTGEFLLDGNLWLPECKSVGFEDHNERICKDRDHVDCGERGQEGYKAGAKLLALLIAQRVVSPKGRLRRLLLSNGGLHEEAQRAWKYIVRSFRKIETRGRLTNRDAPASPLVAAMLERLGKGRSVKDLGSLFRSNAELELALRHRAASAFGIRLDRIPGAR